MSSRALSVLVAGLFGVACFAAAADEVTHGIALGKQEYQAKCASCHGGSGRGEGPVAELLPRIVPDLTSLADRHGGLFPTQLAWATIDGRSLDDHVQRYRGMPVWGQDFRNEALSSPSYRAPEAYAGERIGALVDYLVMLQAGWAGPAPRE